MYSYSVPLMPSPSSVAQTGLDEVSLHPAPAYLTADCHFTNFLQDRFVHRIKVLDCGCWLWIGSLNRNGYGYVHWRGKMRVAHRAVWEQLVGPVPENKILDHVRERGCLHRACVNPAHLEPVTH